MDKEQFAELMKQLEQLNENLEYIAADVHSVDNTLDKIKEEIRKKR